LHQNRSPTGTNSTKKRTRVHCRTHDDDDVENQTKDYENSVTRKFNELSNRGRNVQFDDYNYNRTHKTVRIELSTKLHYQFVRSPR